jgi:predicted transcriptional regulator of viral defense system
MTIYKKINKIYSTKQKFFTTKDLKDTLEIENRRTFEQTIKRLEEENILTKIERGKYLKTNSNYQKFEIAQFIYNPSYISFETALSYHNLINQLPFEITCATPKRGVEKEFEEQIYSYLHMQKELYIGFTKEDGYLIALPEKAIFDQIYMSITGTKSENIIKEIEKDSFDIDKVLEYIKPLSKKYKKAIKNKIYEIFNVN